MLIRWLVSMNLFLKDHIPKVEAELDRLVPERAGQPQEELYAAARYALFTGGKRLRPILCLSACEAVGGDTQLALIPACALEMIHTYSLIHDDLPCMDNDDFRRGKPTLHKAFREGLALLAGDFLLTRAFETIALSPHLPPLLKVELIQVLARQSGGDGMIGGQVIDIDPRQQAFKLPALEQMHLMKTGALIQASVVFGALVGGASAPIVDRLALFGEKIGLAFQVIDDVIDVVSPAAKHGKGSDLNNHKTTYVTLLGLEGAQNTADQLMQEAVEIVQELPINGSDLIELAEFVAHRKV